MNQHPKNRRPAEIRRAVQRDLARHARREPGHKSFWRWLALLGSVGWPIAGGAVGGAWAGHVLDGRFGTGERLTLTLLAMGAALGSWIAWRLVSGNHS